MERRPWSEWSRGRPLSPRGLAKLLKDFDITPNTIRVSGGSTPKGYKRADFKKVWNRYGIPTKDPRILSATTPQVPSSGHSGDSLSATNPDGVADRNPPKAPSNGGCGVVADTKPLSRGNVAVATSQSPSAPRIPPKAVTAEREARARADAIDAAEERAAILEYDGGLPRTEAERRAEREFGLEPGTPGDRDAP